MFRRFLVCLTVALIGSCENSIKTAQLNLVDQKVIINQDQLQESITRGYNIYSDFCIQCHLPDGLGVQGEFPPLAGSNWLREKRQESIHAVKYGQLGKITVNDVTYDGVMAPMGLSNKEIADVLNYVMNSWGNSQSEIVTEAEVSAVEK
jgi:mono/diheme cytochrome c family protein